MRLYSFNDIALAIGAHENTVRGWSRRHDWPIPEALQGPKGMVLFTSDQVDQIKDWAKERENEAA